MDVDTRSEDSNDSEEIMPDLVYDSDDSDDMQLKQQTARRRSTMTQQARKQGQSQGSPTSSLTVTSSNTGSNTHVGGEDFEWFRTFSTHPGFALDEMTIACSSIVDRPITRRIYKKKVPEGVQMVVIANKLQVAA